MRSLFLMQGCFTTALLVAVRGQATLKGSGVCTRQGSSGASEGAMGTTAAEPLEEDDPVLLLRRVQAENAAKTAAIGGPEVPARHSCGTDFFGREVAPSFSANGEEDIAGKPKGTERKRTIAAGSAAAAPRASASSASNPFLDRLNKMNDEAKSTSFPTYDAAAESRRKTIEQKIKEERSKMLVFRDVGMDLDKPILSRDVFLILKYFRYGMEFAVDNELERMLRYFNEHAVNELKIIQDSKLMRGPPTLSKTLRAGARRTPTAFLTPGHRSYGAVPRLPPLGRSSSTAAGGTVASGDHAPGQTAAATVTMMPEPPFQITSSFPQVHCAPLRPFCSPPDPAVTAKLQGLLRTSAGVSSFATHFAEPRAAGAIPDSFRSCDEKQFITLTPSMFRRPAVVIVSQLGQKFGAEGDAQWRRLAYLSICPALLPYLDTLPPQAAGGKAGTTGGPASASWGSGRQGAGHTRSVNLPIDVVSLRSTDVFKHRWIHSLYVRRFSRSLAVRDPLEDEEKTANAIGCALTMATTFVGKQLLTPFYPVLGARNYLLPHVMLVDHEGVIRWMSGGCPDAYEEHIFPSLLKQLEAEYYTAHTTVN